MPFQIKEIIEDGIHRWTVVHCTCDLNNETDKLITEIANKVREAYGENEIMDYATALQSKQLETDPLVEDAYDLTAIRAAFLLSLPNSEEEGKKPEWLTNYRSESTEMVAQSVLGICYSVLFPTSPQRGKTNANMPILGFDGWGVLETDTDDFCLVFVQVKGTDENDRPPSQADVLLEECCCIPREPAKICRALIAMHNNLSDSPIKVFVVKMLQLLGKNKLPRMVVAPVIIRGRVMAHADDLLPFNGNGHSFSPAIGRGVTVSIGVDLGEFGRKVMSCARTA